MKFTAEVQAKIDDAKERGLTPKMLKLGQATYVFRAITRAEYEDIQATIMANQKETAREEGEATLFMTGVVFPEIKDVSAVPAGHITTTCEAIMDNSGFGVEPEITEL